MELKGAVRNDLTQIVSCVVWLLKHLEGKTFREMSGEFCGT